MFADDNQNTAIGNPITTNMDNNSMGLPPPTPVGTAYISTKNSLRVRATASLGSSVIAYLYRNDQIEILENAPYWSHIQYYTKDGRAHEGYILSIYTRAPTKIDMIRNSIISFADAEMDSTIPT